MNRKDLEDEKGFLIESRNRLTRILREARANPTHNTLVIEGLSQEISYLQDRINILENLTD